jgi:L-asparaginase II
MSAELLYTTRGDLVETIQRGHVAVVDARGRLIAIDLQEKNRKRSGIPYPETTA